MPYIIDSYKHNIPREASTTWKVVKNYAGTAMTEYIMKAASDTFFADLKTTLSKTNLNISYDNTNYKITLFGHQLYIPVTPIYYSTTLNDAQTGVPRCYIDGMYDLERGLYGYYRRNAAATSYLGSGNGLYARMSIFDNIYSKNSMTYKIMVYYQDNYLLVQYLTPRNEVAPLFCIIKGSLKNSDSVITYVSANPNLFYRAPGESNAANHNNTTYGSIDSTIISYHDYGDCILPGSHTLFIDGTPMFSSPVNATQSYIGQYGLGIYFHSERPDRLNFDLRTLQNVEKYYIKPVKLYNDQIDFPNLYFGDEKMEFDKFYYINNTDYYCPGDIGVDCNNMYFKQVWWPIFLLKL